MQSKSWDCNRLAQDEAAHRLANLLQVTVHNLDRASQTVDGAAKQALGSAIGQITAACRLQQLLDVPAEEPMQAEGYLRSLGENLHRLMLDPAGHLLDIDVDPAANLVLPAPLLRLLGQVVVEAVVNASKHAYPGSRGGRILLKLAGVTPWLSCSIADDGIGNRAKLGRPGSRGMALINGLAQQMGGRCRWVFGNRGTEVQVTWPVAQQATAATRE